MCIIAIKKAGVKMPSQKIMEQMWDSNSDGAGYMYPDDGEVVIEKGFMNYKSLKESLAALAKDKDLFETPLILHFRIGTHGGNTPENTHPFPVTESIPEMKKLNNTASLAVAHNGIINIYPRFGISDTMEYIATQMALLRRVKPDFYKDDVCKQLLLNATGSKLAFMDKDGRIELVGKFQEDNKIIYSNSGYLPRFEYPATTASSLTYKGMYKDSAFLVEIMRLTSDDGILLYPSGAEADLDGYSIDERGNIYFETKNSTHGFVYRVRGMGKPVDYDGKPIEFDWKRVESMYTYG